MKSLIHICAPNSAPTTLCGGVWPLERFVFQDSTQMLRYLHRQDLICPECKDRNDVGDVVIALGGSTRSVA